MCDYDLPLALIFEEILTDKPPKEAEEGNRQISLRIKRPPSQCLCIEMAVSIFIMV